MKLSRVILFFSMAFIAIAAFAQDQASIDADFFAELMKAIQGFGGLSMMLKISAVITLVVSTMKVSLFKPVWQKLGSAQVFVAPGLGIVAGLLGLGAGGAEVTFASVMAYFAAGTGAIALHEILDVVKVMPGIGPVWLGVIALIESATGGTNPPPKV